jgi:hypothetical protein
LEGASSLVKVNFAKLAGDKQTQATLPAASRWNFLLNILLRVYSLDLQQWLLATQPFALSSSGYCFDFYHHHNLIDK